MRADASVTQWIGRLKAGDPDAAQKLWERYFRRLVGLARKKLRAAPRRAADEEDVALSAFDSFCRAAGQGGLVEHATAAPLLPALVLRQVKRLAGGEEDEELPQVQSVVQSGKAVLLGPPAEAVEGAEGDVFLVGGAAGRSAELLFGQTNQATEVTLPQLLGRVRVAGLEPVDPLGDGRVGAHGAR